mgnify:CR=1 FL=1
MEHAEALGGPVVVGAATAEQANRVIDEHLLLPLTEKEVEELVRSIHGNADASEVFNLSGGNALMARELAHAAGVGFGDRPGTPPWNEGEEPEIEEVRVLNTSLPRYTTTQVVDYELAIVVDSRPVG